MKKEEISQKAQEFAKENYFKRWLIGGLIFIVVLAIFFWVWIYYAVAPSFHIGRQNIEMCQKDMRVMMATPGMSFRIIWDTTRKDGLYMRVQPITPLRENKVAGTTDTVRFLKTGLFKLVECEDDKSK